MDVARQHLQVVVVCSQNLQLAGIGHDSVKIYKKYRETEHDHNIGL